MPATLSVGAKSVIPRTPEETALRPWFAYVKSLKGETHRQRTLRQPLEDNLADTAEALEKTLADAASKKKIIKSLRQRVAALTGEIALMKTRNEKMRDVTGLRIKELDSEVQRHKKTIENMQNTAEATSAKFSEDQQAAKKRITSLQGELSAMQLRNKMSNSSVSGLERDIAQEQQRSKDLSGKLDNTCEMLRRMTSNFNSQKFQLERAQGLADDRASALESQRESLSQANEKIRKIEKDLKAAQKQHVAREKDLLRAQEKLKAEAESLLREKDESHSKKN